MEEETVEKYLEVLTAKDNFRPYLAEDAINNLSFIFHGELSSVEAYVYTAKALDPSEGIPQYVTLSAERKKKDGDKVIKEAFDLLEYIIVNFPNAAELVSKDVMMWSVLFLNKDVSNDVKSNVIHVAETVVRSCRCVHVQWEDVMKTLRSCLKNELKMPPTLQKYLFSLLGAICELRPEVVHHFQHWFFCVICQAFRKFETSKKESDVLVEACFLGLSGLLVNFPATDEISEVIYKNLQEYSRFRVEGRRNTITRAALQVFCKHAAQFSSLIYNSYRDWHAVLLEWLECQASENRQLGILALEKYYHVVATHLKSSPENGQVVFDYFKKHLVLSSRDIYPLKNVLLCLSALAGVYLKYSTEPELMETAMSLLAAASSVSEYNPSVLGMQLEVTSCVYLKLAVRPDRTIIEKLAVALVESFNHIESVFQPHTLRGLENSFAEWTRCGDMDHQLWLVVYQSLIRCCAYPIVADVQLLEEKERVVSYKDFLLLWIHLLTISSRSGGEELKRTLGRVVYDAFMENFLKIITKLDLNLKVLSTEYSDPALAMEAESPNDFQIFVNIVDLFQDLIPVSDTCHFWKWLPEVLTECVKLCALQPLVSGFYKVIATCFEVALKENQTFPDVELVGFVGDAMKRVDSQKDDLLIANLRMILLAPTPVIAEVPHLLSPVVVTAARVGRGYPDLLELCINALDRWYVQIPDEDFRPVITEVLPHLGSILLTPVTQNKEVSTQKVSTLKSRGKVRRRVTGPNDRKVLVLQKQFLLFMAKLDQRICMAALAPSQNKGILSGSELVYKIPLPDTKLSLVLNPLLPRITELALGCGDRSTRVTACELLHGALLIALARTQKPNSNPELLRRLLQAALTLGCDTDRVIRDLFNPLVIQMTHYFSSMIQLHSKESQVVIEVLIGAVTQSHDSGLRDFAARCLKEFVVWSARQATPDMLNVAPYNVQAVLRILCDYAIHPDRSRRIGAAVAFNLLYTEIREDVEILDLYWLKLYYYFVRSLEMCTSDEDARLVTAAVKHIQRPFLERNDLFAVCPAERRIPPGLGGGALKDVTVFSLKHCRSLNVFLRDVSQGFVKKLVEQEYDSIGAFMRQNGISIEFQVCEAGEEKNCVAVLDYAMWLLKEEAVTLEDLRNEAKVAAAAKNLLNLYQDSPSKGIITLMSFLSKITETLDSDSVERVRRLFLHEKLGLEAAKSEFVQFLTALRTKSIHGSLFASQLPDFSEKQLIENLKKLDESSLKKFLLFFEVMYASGSLTETYCGNHIISSLFDRLFEVRGRKTVCVRVESNLQRCLQNIFHFVVGKGLNAETMIELLTDESDDAVVDDGGRKLTKGEHFFTVFLTELLSFLVQQRDTVALLRTQKATGFKWMIKILENLRDGSGQKAVTIKLFVMAILLDWDEWKNAFQRSQLFALLKAMAQVLGDPCGCFKDVRAVLEWFHATPRQSLSSPDVIAFFELLPQFVSSQEVCDDSLDRSLTLFERKWLLFEGGSEAKRRCSPTVLKSVLENLLACFTKTGSFTVFRYTAVSVAQNPTMLKEDDLKAAMNQFVEKSLQEHVVAAAVVLYGLITETLVDRPSVVSVTNLLLEILKASPKEAAINFFEKNVIDILSILKSKLSERKVRDLVRKIAVTDLIGVLYMKTTIDDRKRIQTRQPGRRDMFKKIITACNLQPLNGNRTEEDELLRILNCSRVNFLCVFATNFQEENYFTHFLFSDGLWESIIDETKEHTFPMEFLRIPKRKVVKTLVRKPAKYASEDASSPATNFAQSHTSTLFESTLSEDVRSFDLTHATVTQTPMSLGSHEMTVELEMDALNQHEVVPNLCALLHDMVDKKLTSWVTFFMKNLQESSSRNVRLTVLKVLHNLHLEGLIESNGYDAQLAPVVLKSIVDLFGDGPVNYFMVDLVNMLIDWRSVFNADDSSNLTRLVECFATKPGSQQRHVLKYVFEVLGKVISAGQHQLDASKLTEMLVRHISVENVSESDMYVILLFASILLDKKLVLASEFGGLVRWLLSARNNAKNSILAAETCGQALHAFRDSENFPEVFEIVRQHITRLRSTQISDVMLLYHIHQFYPEISSSFEATLIDRALSEQGELKNKSLQLLLTHVERQFSLSDTTQFETLGENTLKSKKTPAQESLLRIVLVILDTLDDATVRKLAPDVVTLSQHADVKLRDLASQVLMSIYRRYDGDNSFNDVVATCKIALIERLNDLETSVRERCLNFWCESKVPVPTKKRMLFILKELYTPETEADFVEYANRLLLEASSSTPDYKLEIFDHPLMECTYSQMQLLVSWRAQHVSAPMFAPSIATELGRINMELPGTSVNLRLRETARSLLFSPTVSDSNAAVPSAAPAPSPETKFKKPVPKRFSKTARPAVYARYATAKKQEENASAQERIKQREAGVKIYREYREGDFPDIHMLHSQFLSLLSALIGKDAQFSQELMIGLFAGIAKLNDRQSFVEETEQCFNEILEKSYHGDPIAIGAVFQIALFNQISLRPKLVSRVARSSNLLSTGCLLIETSISNDCQGPSPPKRGRGTGDGSDMASHWLLTAELFYELKETRALRGVLLDKLLVDGVAKEAILSEVVMDWTNAAENYEELLRTNSESPDMNNFYSQSYFACLANLSKWSELVKCIEQSVQSDPGPQQLWEASWCSDVLLPYYVKAQMMVCLSDGTPTFEDFVKESVQHPQRRQRMSKFADELSVAYWLKKDIAQAISYAFKSLTAFISAWSSANEWDIQRKKTFLTNLLITSEIQTIVSVLTSSSPSSVVEQMTEAAAKEAPCEYSDLVSWDVKLSLRKKFSTFLRDHAITGESQVSFFDEKLIDTQLSFVKAAIEHGNVNSLRKYLFATKRPEMSESQKSQWQHLRHLVNIVEVKKEKIDPELKLEKYANLWEDIAKRSDSSAAQMNRSMLTVITEMISECDSSRTNPEGLAFLPVEKRDLKGCWLKCADKTVESLSSTAQRGQVYVQMVHFYRQNFPEICLPVIHLLLKAMQCDSAEARELFGSILTMEGLQDFEETVEESTKVPTWMFLLWRNQLVAHLTGKPIKMFQDILLRIAREYPAALSYGLRISLENFSTDLKKTRFVQELSSLVLSNFTEESFVCEVGKIANPLLRLKHFLVKLEFADSPENRAEVVQQLIMLANETGDNRHPVRQFKADIEALNTIRDEKRMKAMVERLKSALSKVEDKKLSTRLQNFSSWLSEFNETESGLEVPGQYSGLSEPKVWRHVRVATFKPDVVVMASKTQPVKLTMIGNDAQEYSFLVKFGEDLRQDERIQQVLGQMKRTLAANKVTAELELDGYGVIPLTSSWGLIEWVDSVKSLSTLMNLPKDKINKVANDHLYFLGGGNHDPVTSHRLGYVTKSNEEAIAAYERGVAFLGRNALRQGFWRLSASPQQFFGLRTNFATSLAVMNVANWILGVGDRHLENILVSTSTGRALGIDFGMAFGFATQFLPLPELVPFRLTPQIIQVFSPLNESGWLKQTMVDSLRVLRENPVLLLAMLEVFVQEPCLDWVQRAKRLAAEQGGNIATQSTCYLKTKILAVRKKLEGENPLKGMEADLETGRTMDKCLLRQIAVLRGDTRPRFRLPSTGLSPEQQVDSLIDLATDPLVLSFTYVGWSPWL